MKLWLLRCVLDSEGEAGKPWKPWYDKAFGFVVRAPNEKEARELAATEAGDEGGDAWTDAKHSTCIELKPKGDAGVVIRDFAAA